jgi:glutamyl-tRNA reductase
MSIFVIGINHKTSPVAVREKIYFGTDKLPLYLQDLLSQEIVSEAVLVSTCNRSELYCEAADSHAIRAWFCAQTSLDPQLLSSMLYLHTDEEAVAHLFRVVCGLDSMVLGETQILGQLKEAFYESCTAGAVQSLFHRLFQQAFAIAKEIRTTTAIGACPVSLASAAVHFSKQQLSDHCQKSLHKANIALIGSGEMSSLLLRYLHPQVSTPIRVITRNVQNALSLPAKIFSFDQLVDVLSEADLVFSATGSAVPILNQSTMKQIMQARQEKPITCIDIAVPRDIDESVKSLSQVYLYCIDDLKKIIEENRQGREHAALKAQEMIEIKSKAFMQESELLEKVSHTIRAYRHQIQTICRAELMKAKAQLKQGGDPQQVIETFAHAFTNKLLHAPSVQLRQAGAEGRLEILKLAKQLFSLSDVEAERL